MTVLVTGARGNIKPLFVARLHAAGQQAAITGLRIQSWFATNARRDWALAILRQPSKNLDTLGESREKPLLSFKRVIKRVVIKRVKVLPPPPPSHSEPFVVLPGDRRLRTGQRRDVVPTNRSRPPRRRLVQGDHLAGLQEEIRRPLLLQVRVGLATPGAKSASSSSPSPTTCSRSSQQGDASGRSRRRCRSGDPRSWTARSAAPEPTSSLWASGMSQRCSETHRISFGLSVSVGAACRLNKGKNGSPWRDANTGAAGRFGQQERSGIRPTCPRIAVSRPRSVTSRPRGAPCPRVRLVYTNVPNRCAGPMCPTDVPAVRPPSPNQGSPWKSSSSRTPQPGRARRRGRRRADRPQARRAVRGGDRFDAAAGVPGAGGEGRGRRGRHAG